MNKIALLKLAELLEDPEVHEENFDLTSWINDSEGIISMGFDEPGFEDVATALKWRMRRDRRMEIPHKCGMTCCALGWAGLNKWFIYRGFKTTCEGSISYREAQGWEAAEDFFDISGDHAIGLFSDESYPEDVTKLDVAKRVREFVRHGYLS